MLMTFTEILQLIIMKGGEVPVGTKKYYVRFTQPILTINPQFRGLYRGEHRNLRDFIRKTRLFKGK